MLEYIGTVLLLFFLVGYCDHVGDMVGGGGVVNVDGAFVVYVG